MCCPLQAWRPLLISANVANSRWKLRKPFGFSVSLHTFWLCRWRRSLFELMPPAGTKGGDRFTAFEW